MVVFLEGVIDQKVQLPPEILLSVGVSKYFLYGLFAILLGLCQKSLGSDAKFNSAPNPSSLRNNQCNIANPGRKYLEIPMESSIFVRSGTV